MKRIFLVLALCISAQYLFAQQEDSIGKFRKNVIRYNLSGALLFGFDKYIVVGYERVINSRQSISMNVGRASLPKLVNIITDSFSLQKDLRNTGTNFSLDYRFYLAKENRYRPPHGLYIGPYYSYNRFERENEFSFKRANGAVQAGETNTSLTIHTIGAELGYQFVFWEKLTLDMVLIGPGISSYRIKSTFEGTLDEDDRQQLREAIEDVLTQRFPGMNYVLGDKHLDANGVLNTTNVGFRYIIHIGFLF